MIKTYNVQFNKQYLKDLQKIPKKDQSFIKKCILSLSSDPRPEGCKKLKGTRDTIYRIRCGDYRIVYSIQDDLLIVLVIEVGHRKEVYRDF